MRRLRHPHTASHSHNRKKNPAKPGRFTLLAREQYTHKKQKCRLCSWKCVFKITCAEGVAALQVVELRVTWCAAAPSDPRSAKVTLAQGAAGEPRAPDGPRACGRATRVRVRTWSGSDGSGDGGGGGGGW
jgi:hypothetical protein